MGACCAAGCLPPGWCGPALVINAHNAPHDPFRLRQLDSSDHSSSKKRQLRPKEDSQSEGVLPWIHRDLPTEIHKLFLLKQQIGSGTTSQVFLAIRKLDSTPLACKVIPKPRGFDNEDKFLLRQLRREIKILQQLEHPNIIRYSNMVETSSTIYCFMELLAGGELFEHLCENGPMPQLQAAFMMHGVVSAIAHMHSRGIVHRDIKAENLMLLSRASVWPVVKIIDFGFSCELNSNVPATNSFLGTAGYLAPEIRQHRDYSKTVDVWALGVLMYLVLTCQLPFECEIDDLTTNRRDVKDHFTLQFPLRHWPSPETDSVQSLICSMLDVDAASRVNAVQCLRHPWLSGQHFNYSFADADKSTSGKKAKSTLRCLSMPELTQISVEEDELSPKPAETSDVDWPDGHGWPADNGGFEF